MTVSSDVLKAQQPTTNSLVPHILFGMFLLELLFLFVKKLNASAYGVFDLLEKLFPIIALVLIVGFLRPKLNHHWWMALMFFVAYMAYGFAISIAQQKGWHIIAVQTYHELKFFPILFLFAMVKCEPVWARRTYAVIKPIIILTLLLIAFQVAAPGVYDAVFQNGGHFEKGFIGGIALPRLVGWFWHPGQIALFFLITAVFVIVQRRAGEMPFAFSLVTLCIVFVTFAIQRFELLILFMVLTIIGVCRYLAIDVRPYLARFLLISFSGLILYIISDEAHYWQLLEALESPRTVFLVEAFFAMQESGYWGAGWGTIGSHAAADVAKVYDYNAMKDLWWVKEGKYFYDTFWPHVIGETGLPGFCLLLLTMVSMIRALNKMESSIILFVLILTSALSSNIQSIYHLCVFGWFILLFENAGTAPTAVTSQQPYPHSPSPATKPLGVYAHEAS